MRDELFSQLRDLETLGRELRTLLQSEPDVEKMAGEDAYRVAEALLAVRDANAALAPLHQSLHLRAMQRAADRAASVRDAAQSDLDRALGTHPQATAASEGPRPTMIDLPRDEPDSEPPTGGSWVPVAPRPVPVLAGGAARTFEEAQELPRNP